MDNSWSNHEPAPLEFTHGQALIIFHRQREKYGQESTLEMDGVWFNKILAEAKNMTYAKYPKQNLNKAIPKSEM